MNFLFLAAFGDAVMSPYSNVSSFEEMDDFIGAYQAGGEL